MSSIQQYTLPTTAVIGSLSIAQNQRVYLSATEDIRVAYDEAELADGRNYFLIQFNKTSEQTLPFVIPPSSAMNSQRALYFRTHTSATIVYVWYMGE